MMNKIHNNSSIEHIIFNNTLNSDYDDLIKSIHKDPNAPSIISICGETPCHIAIYKNDITMLQILLQHSNVNPNIINQDGNNLIHLACIFGYYDIITLLYETKQCQLTNKNNKKQTPYDITQLAVDDDIILLHRLFAEYKYTTNSDNSNHHHHKRESNINNNDNNTIDHDQAIMRQVRSGRYQCGLYLKEKMLIDGNTLVANMIQNSMDNMNERRRKMRIIRGLNHEIYTSYYSDITFPQNINTKPWTQSDINYFHSYQYGANKVIRTVYACDYVNNAIKVGFYQALQRRNDIKKLPNIYKLTTINND